MRRAWMVVVLALAVCTIATIPQDEAWQKQRFQEKLLEWSDGPDVPSRTTARQEMTQFGKWIEKELLDRLDSCSTYQRINFLAVLRDREYRAVLPFAIKLFPKAIQQCRDANLQAHKIAEIWDKYRKAKKAGDAAGEADLEAKMDEAKVGMPWNEVTQGDEVAICSQIIMAWGREEALSQAVDLAIKSAQDDIGEWGAVKRAKTHTRDDMVLQAGTDEWNRLYDPVWRVLIKLSRRSLKPAVMDSARQRLTAFFGDLEKKEVSKNQAAALSRYYQVLDGFDKTKRGETEEDENKVREKPPGDDGIGIIKG